MKFNVLSVLLVTLVLLGGFFRFYNLDWGEGLFFHPDEYHLVISANQLSFPNQMNPHFFSYGTVIIYLIYFTKLLFLTMNHTLTTMNLFLIGRFYSALFSTLTIPLIYFISLKILPKPYALLAVFLTALTPGLIQQAHFATPESALIFFLLASLLFILNFAQNKKILWFALASISTGLTLGVKISSMVFLPTLLFGVLLQTWPSFSKFLKFFLLSFILVALFFFIGAPFVFLDFTHFWQSFQYESRLAIGQIPVFYTRQFMETTPVLFQLQKIFPYALGPALLVFGLTGFGLLFYMVFKKSNQQKALFLILITFCLLFLSNAFLFAKWTRFISPTFPFFAIFSVYFLFTLKSYFTNHRSFFLILNSTFLILTLLWSMAFFSIYLKDDVRITASSWLEKNIPPGSVILVEEGNMIDLPLRGNFEKVSVDFYSLEDNAHTSQKLQEALGKADYFIIQSRRVFLNHQRLLEKFPQTASFYQKLFQGSLGFQQITEFTSYPRLQIGPWKIEFPDERAEETWSVFDHPVIRVFKKI